MALRLCDNLLEQGYVKERLKSAMRKFYGRYGDLIKQYEVTLSGIFSAWLYTITPIRLYNRSWPYYRCMTRVCIFHVKHRCDVTLLSFESKIYVCQSNITPRSPISNALQSNILQFLDWLSRFPEHHTPWSAKAIIKPCGYKYSKSKKKSNKLKPRWAHA